MSLTRETIEDLAPDQSSLSAARKLLAPKKWPITASGNGGGLLWGECQGSGSMPYRVVYVPGDRGYKCSCPSRKFPCKHVLALMWLKVDDAAEFAPADVPDWINEWMSRRRGTSSASSDEAAKPKPKRSLDAAAAEPEKPKKPVDPKRAAAQKERNRKQREKQILTGLDELDTWLQDQFARGLASFSSIATEQTRTISRRLADAKAPALATRVEELSARLFAVPEPQRGAYLTERFGSLHLLAEAYRRQDQLPEDLRADVRALIGWTTDRATVLEDTSTQQLRASWLVVGRAEEVQPDRLRRIETWLLRTDDEDLQTALLLDFVPVSGGSTGVAHAIGERLDATVAFYPSSVPMRCVLVERHDTPAPANPTWPGQSLEQALTTSEAQRARHPWLDRWPIVADDLRVVATRSGALWLTDGQGTNGMPLDPAQQQSAYPLVGIDAFRGFALHDGGQVQLQFARTILGDWRSS